MFDIIARKKPLRLLTIEVFAQSGTKRTKVEVWTKIGSYSGYEKRQKRWTRIRVDRISGKGHSTPVPLKKFKCPIVVKTRKTQAFYVHSNSRILYSTFATKSDLTVKNDDAELRRGVGLLKRFGAPSSSYLWNGVVNYDESGSKNGCSWKPSPKVMKQPVTGMARRKKGKIKGVLRRKKGKTKGTRRRKKGKTKGTRRRKKGKTKGTRRRNKNKPRRM